VAENKGKILWVDDEIELLKPHIMFLEEKGYLVTPVTNAEDAIALARNNDYQLVLLDEMMPGMDGLSALNELKAINPGLPVIMITKSEEEQIMDQAIGGKIDDYLTKPVNPSQILLVCKKIIERKSITGQRLSRDYTTEFSRIMSRIMGPMDWPDWVDIHVKLSEWDIELDQHPDLGLRQTLYDQKRDCNTEFGRFVEKNYLDWISNDNGPMLSTDVVEKTVIPHIKENKNTILIVIDNLRVDQWLILEPILRNLFRIKRDYYYSILPTATPYSRNAIFSGLYPLEIEKYYPDLWRGNDESNDTSRNQYEHELLTDQVKRLGIELKSEPKYTKILDIQESKNLVRRIQEFTQVPLSAIVINFVDLLAHSRSSSDLLKEMIPNESAFRAMTRSWFEHSHILKAIRELADSGSTLIITSDHGSIRGLHGAKVIGDRETSTSLRYKYGKNIKADKKYAMYIKDPQKYKLPVRGVNTNYLIAKEDFYFVYPTNYHYYLNYYADSFQHGGISLEEIILPVITLNPR
jgi:CheY-like chemotaxis protein